MAEKRTEPGHEHDTTNYTSRLRTVAIAAHQTHPSGLAIQSHQNCQIPGRSNQQRCALSPDEVIATYTMLLTRVLAAPIKVLNAIVRRRRFAGVRGMFLNEYIPTPVSAK